jgi:hypothetical protein
MYFLHFFCTICIFFVIYTFDKFLISRFKSFELGNSDFLIYYGFLIFVSLLMMVFVFFLNKESIYLFFLFGVV